MSEASMIDLRVETKYVEFYRYFLKIVFSDEK